MGCGVDWRGVVWRGVNDENAEKVVKKVVKLSGSKLEELLSHLGCSQDQLADFGYYSTSACGDGKNSAGEFITYEPSSDLRDSESVPLAQEIHEYFSVSQEWNFS